MVPLLVQRLVDLVVDGGRWWDLPVCSLGLLVVFAAQAGAGQARPVPAEEDGQPLNDLQKSILAATRKLRGDGHPADAP